MSRLHRRLYRLDDLRQQFAHDGADTCLLRWCQRWMWLGLFISHKNTLSVMV